MTPEQNKVLIETSADIKTILTALSRLEKDLEKLENSSKDMNEKIIGNKKDIEFLDKRIGDNYKNQQNDIDGAFSKITSCSDSKEKYINDQIKLSNSSLQIKFYVAILTAISGLVFAIIKDTFTK
jgi:predicted  nucleic acid-binding Zn-ribbon protein